MREVMRFKNVIVHMHKRLSDNVPLMLKVFDELIESV